MLNIDFDFSSVAIVSNIFACFIIGFLAYRIYQKQVVKPRVWKIFLVLLIGLFSFSINWTIFDTLLKVAILPLGVWILNFILDGKGGKWKTYRSYAWLGFLANFIFLSSTLIAIPIHHKIYPQNEPSTYISNIENASIINTHPAASELSLNKGSLQNQLHTMKKTRIFNERWYAETYVDYDSKKRNERFPYQLIGTTSKWGSGIRTIIHIEDDGKGILISTANKQVYFRTKSSLFEGVEK